MHRRDLAEMVQATVLFTNLKLEQLIKEAGKFLIGGYRYACYYSWDDPACNNPIIDPTCRTLSR